jgi:hypothetical protein
MAPVAPRGPSQTRGDKCFSGPNGIGRVTSRCSPLGLLVVGELDERLGLGELIEQHLLGKTRNQSLQNEDGYCVVLPSELPKRKS